MKKMPVTYRGWVVAFALTVLPVFCLQADVDYSYQGNPFTVADPPYTAGDSISGEFSVALPIKPLLPLTDISAVLTDFSFSDGQQIRTPANTTVCAFVVATDAAGNIINWMVLLREAPTPAIGDPMRFMDITTGLDQVGIGPSPGTACDSIVPTVSASNVSGGNWSVTLPPTMPTDYNYTGAPFDFAQSPYVLGDNITGSFTLTGKLPVFLPSTNLTSALLDFSFTDGQQTRTPSNSTICDFSVETDATGNIARWRVILREAPTPMPGDPQQTLDVSTNSDVAGTGPANTTACGDLILNPAGQANSGGSWSSSAILTVQPMMYGYTGQRFTSVEAPYTTNDRITGIITVNRAIPANFMVSDLSTSLLSLSFTDGIQTRSLGNTTICSFEVTTNDEGDIVDWTVVLREAPTPALGNPQMTLDTITAGDVVGTGAANTSACGDLTLFPSGMNSLTGSWRSILAVEEVPVFSQIGMTIMILMVLLIAVQRIRAGRKLMRL